MILPPSRDTPSTTSWVTSEIITNSRSPQKSRHAESASRCASCILLLIRDAFCLSLLILIFLIMVIHYIVICSDVRRRFKKHKQIKSSDQSYQEAQAEHVLYVYISLLASRGSFIKYFTLFKLSVKFKMLFKLSVFLD